VKWNFERMNELQLQFRRDDDLAQEGYITVLSGPAHPYHRHFNPGPGISLGYDDLKVIEAYEFLSSIASGKQGEPGFREAAAVVGVTGKHDGRHRKHLRPSGWNQHAVHEREIGEPAVQAGRDLF